MAETMATNGPSSSVRPGKLEMPAGSTRPSFDELYRKYRPALVRYARSRNAIDPEGVANLALFDGHRVLGHLRSDDPRVFQAYLFKATASHVAKERRKRREEPAPIADVDTCDPFDERVIGEIEMQAILELLPPDQGEVLRHRFIDDLSAEETAAVMGKTAGAVRMTQFRAIRRLRRLVFAAAIILAVAIAIVALSRLQAEQMRLAPADDSPQVTENGPPATGQTDARLDEPPPQPDAARTADEQPPVPPATGQTDALPDQPNVGLATDEQPPVPLLPDPAGVVAYEGFDQAPGSTSLDETSVLTIGFAPGSTWTISGGEATISHDPTGLTYSDAAGNRLATLPGGLQVEASTGNPVLRRPYADNASLVGQPYWVAFLARPDRPGIGDAFWTPDGYLNVGAAGMQQYQNYRFVNDETTAIEAQEGVTALILINVRPDGASLWVNPNLTDPGEPLAELSRPPGEATADLMFGFNPLSDGAYTIDEVRVGSTARSVTPTG